MLFLIYLLQILGSSKNKHKDYLVQMCYKGCLLKRQVEDHPLCTCILFIHAVSTASEYACPGDLLTYECIATGGSNVGATIWTGVGIHQFSECSCFCVAISNVVLCIDSTTRSNGTSDSHIFVHWFIVFIPSCSI